MGRGGYSIVTLCSLLCVIMLFILLAHPVSAVALGVNKAKIDFVDVLREGYAQESFVVSTDSEIPITGVLEVEGDIAQWVRFEPENILQDGFVFSASNPQTIVVIIEPPADAANDNYDGLIRLLTGEFARDSDGLIGTSTRAAFKIGTTIEITGVERRQCVIGGSQVKSTETGQPFDFSYSIKNAGNVRVQPDIFLTIYDQSLETVVLESSVSSSKSILPTTSEHFIERISQSLPNGQYWVGVASDDCDGSALLTFDVLERGGIVDSGELVHIDVEPWNKVGDIIPIAALFKNNGVRTVSAKFKGTIMRGQKLVKVIDTDFYTTQPEEIVRIESFFNPDEPGQYEVKGRVLYNNKLTYERSAIINVSGNQTSASSFPWFILFIIMIILLLLLIIKKKKRRRY